MIWEIKINLSFRLHSIEYFIYACLCLWLTECRVFEWRMVVEGHFLAHDVQMQHGAWQRGDVSQARATNSLKGAGRELDEGIIMQGRTYWFTGDPRRSDGGCNYICKTERDIKQQDGEGKWVNVGVSSLTQEAAWWLEHEEELEEVLRLRRRP